MHVILQMPLSVYRTTLFSYLMVAGAIDWNICPEILGMTKGSIARGHRQSPIEPLVIPKTKGQMF